MLTGALIVFSGVLSIAVGLSIWGLMAGLTARGTEQLAADLNRRTFDALASQVDYYGQSTAWAVQLASESLRLTAREHGMDSGVFYSPHGKAQTRRTLLDVAKQFDTMHISFPNAPLHDQGNIEGYLREGDSLTRVLFRNSSLLLYRMDELGNPMGQPFAAVPNYDFRVRPWWPEPTSNGTTYSSVYPDATSVNAVMTTTCPIFGDLAPIAYAPGSRTFPAAINWSAPVQSPRALVAVVGSDINMREFSDYLGRLQIGIHDEGIVYVLDKVGRMFACSNYSIIPVDNVMPHVTSISHPMIEGSIDFIMRSSNLDPSDAVSYEKIPVISYSLVNIHGVPYVVSVDHVSIGPSSERWTGVIVFPADDYFGNSRRASSVALGVSIGAIIPLLSIAFGLVVYYRVSRPLNKISDMLHSTVHDLEFTPRQEQRWDHLSGFREIHSMQNSYQHLISGLKSFSKYAPMDIVRELVATGGEAEQLVESKVCTSYFSDIEGFAGIAEKLDPQDLIIVMKEYFNAMIPPLKANQGTLGDFIGDAIFAFWGAPADDPLHALNGVRTAWAHQERMEGLRRGWENAGFPAMRIRIGINTGMALAGNTGTDSRMKYTLIGDSVNLAARLEHINKYYGTYLICSEDTWREPGVSREFISKVLDVIAVKGKENPVIIREIIGKFGEGTAGQQSVLLDIQKLSEQWLESYLNKRFDVSKELLERIFALDGSDACAMMIARVDSFLEEGVAPDWDGVHVMIRK